VAQIFTFDFARRWLGRSIPGDPEADILIGVCLVRVDLGDQPFSSFNLMELLRPGRKTDLLIAEFA